MLKKIIKKLINGKTLPVMNGKLKGLKLKINKLQRGNVLFNNYEPDKQLAFLTFLKAGKKMNWLGKIINQPFVIDWDKKPAGRDKTAKSLFNQEFKKIEKYKKDVITIYRGIKHLERNNK